MRRRRSASWILPCALSAITAMTPAAEPPDYKSPTKDWAKGPVKWILTVDEEKEFKKLKTDEERAAFVKAFWEKRDPTPGTPENEYEIVFWKRVEQAEKTFKGITRAGALTDMGEVFLLLGPPTKTDRDARGYNTWTFEPSEVTGIKTPLALRFAPSDTGAGPLLLDRKILEQYTAAHPETRGIGWTIPVEPGSTEAAGAPAAAAQPVAEDTSPETQRQVPILEDLLAKGSGPAEVPVQVAFDFYAAVDGTTLASVTLEVPRDAAHGSTEAALQPYARIVPAAAAGTPINLTGDQPFVAAPAHENPPSGFVYQARRNLKPGAYRLAVVVEDKVVKGQKGTLVRSFDVPDYTRNELDLSSISVLAGFSQIEAGMGPDEKQRGAGVYVLGSFRLVPRAVLVLTRDEALSFYYQVYHPTPDAATGRFSLEETYAFFLKDGENWKPFRKPLVRPRQGQVELYSIDMKDFLVPNMKLPAEFRMEVKVVDKPSGREVKREIFFTVR